MLAALALVAAGPALADRALLIGIDAYDTDDRIPRLEGAVNDVVAMRAFLTGHAGYAPDRILSLTDAEATRDGILDALEGWLVDGTAPGERVFLFFAGHGYQVPSLTEGEGFDQVLIPHDSFLDGEGDLHRFIRDKELNGILGRLADREVTVVVDSCHSGGITRAVLPAEMPVTRFPLPLLRAQQAAGRATAPVRSVAGAGRGLRRSSAIVESTDRRTVWSAVSSHQLAFEDDQLQDPGGFFTSRFIRGLAAGEADLNGDGTVTHAELHAWLMQKSEGFCEALGPACVFGLTPTLEVPLERQIAPVLTVIQSVTELPVATVPPAPVAALPLAEVVEAALVVPAQAQTPPGEVRIDIEAPTPLRQGARVRFRVETDFDGFLTVFDINPAGRLVQLFPNRFSAAQGRDNAIRAGFPITIPDATYGFEFTVAPPLGAGRLVAVVTAEPLEMSDIAPASRGLVVEEVATSARPDADVLFALADRLRAAWTGDLHDRQPRYALAVRDYLTEP